MSVAWPSRLVLLAVLALLPVELTPADGSATPTADGKTSRLDTTSVTASIVRTAAFVDDASTADIEGVKRGLDALRAGDIGAARAARDSLGKHSLDRHVVSWAIAMRGGNALSSSEIAATAADLPGWPGMEALRRNTELALFREAASPAATIRAFGGSAPETGKGAIALARAFVALGDPDAAKRMLAPLWRTMKLDADDEATILTEFGTLLPVSDHRFRMERLLYAERAKAAERIAPYARAEALARAWVAVLRRDPTSAELVAAVPPEQRSAGFSFVQAKLLRREDELSKAAAIMVAAPRDATSLVDADAWWIERRTLARALLDAGAFKDAYRVAATHAAESPTNVADAEFHAGWLALRALKEPTTAARHFTRIAEIADGAISKARAFYWLGRTAEAGGPGNARDAYERAAHFGTTFYGQLAAQRLGRSTIEVTEPQPSDDDRRNFARREAVQAIGRLEDAGYPALADRLYRDLADQLTSTGELALLAERAQQRGDHFLALKVGKAAASRGLDAGALSHPIGAIPPSANISSTGKALAYAVARQESEFNVGAVSGAGARGLLQLLPGTAKDVAKRSGLPFSQSRLTSDAGYNATLGSTFLSEQLGRFKGSYVLTFAGYNAGPRRAAEWIAKYGDPRGQELDAVVDWIERIPFTETRSYVQRVMENYQVYKMRLTGRFDIATDLVSGRG